jgi:Calx-beta domain/Domain of unknown function (DUF4114)
MAATVSIKESKTILEGNLGTQTLTFDIILSEATLEPVNVAFSISTATDTATIDEDYTVNFDQIVFNPGDPLTKTLTFVIDGDRQIEADEVFTITLVNPIGATLGTNSIATGTILNDDTLPKVSIAATSNAQEPTSPGSFTLTRTGGDIALPLTVNLNYLGSTATVNTDYNTAPTQVTFAAGANTATVVITPIDDDLYERTETVRLSINNSESYQIGDTLGGGASAEISILDNENLPRLGIVPRTQNIVERNTGALANSASFRVLLTGKSATDIIVNYTTGNGSATAGSDYTATSGQLIFLAGSNNPQTILVPIIPDDDLEPDENFGVELTPSVSSEVVIDNSDRVGIAIITNDDNPPSVGITRGINTREPGDIGTFILNRTGSNTRALTVNLAPSGGTATPGIDYQVVNTATFAAGSSTAVVEIRAINDDIYEEVETIALAVQPGSDYLVGGFGGPSTAEIFIGDDESRPFLVITPNIQAIIEKNTGDTPNNASFQIQLTGKSATPISAEYSVINGTATAGSDFIPISGRISFAPGNNIPQTILIPIIPDNNIEPDESFSLQLTNSIGASPTGGASVTILNDDGLPTINIAAGLSAQEPNTNGTFILSRTGNTTTTLTVNLTTATSTATSGIDFQAIDTTATFAVGSSTATIQVQPIDDDIYETTEKVGLALLAGSGYTLGTTTNAEISITDNETQPIISIIPTSQNITEKNNGDPANSASFQIQLSGPSATDITVDYATVNGSATAGSDYTATSGKITFATGSITPQTISIPITSDNTVESDETFTLQLSNPIGASIGAINTATATILNDDILPAITISAGVNAQEPSTTGTFILNRTGDTTSALTVNLAAPTGSASSGIDFQNIGNTITFLAGSNSATVNVIAIDDDIYETAETIGLAIQSGTTYTIGATASAQINITDNEAQPSLSITPSNQSITEKNSGETSNNATFQIQITGKSATPITVDYTTVNGSAQAGSDFTTTSGQLTFAPGSTTPQTVFVPITPDNTVEVDENFTFRLSNAVGASLGTPATAIIFNDDSIPLPKITINLIGNQDLPVEQLPAQNTITLKRDGDLGQPLTIRYLLSRSIGATNQNTNSSATFAAGQSEITIPLTIDSNAIYREIERDTLTLTADPSYNLDELNKTVTINLGNNLNPPNITISDAEIIEGDSGTSLLRFTARLSSPSAQATTVNYQTNNGTAIAGQDYTASTGSLTFAAKEVEKIVEILVINETIVENNENFTITLSNPSNGTTLSTATATGLIRNNDIPIASLIVTDAQAGEPNDLGQFQIAIAAAAEIPVTITYGITGTATPGTDYITLPVTVTIAPGQTSQTIDVTIQDDSLVESPETVQLQLQPSPNYTITPDRNSGTVAIADNDIAPPQLTTLPSSLFQIQNGTGVTSLKFRKTNHQASYRNELSLFTVDDSNGTINGITPTQTGYQQAALGRAQIVFSALSDSTVDLQLDGQIDRYLQLGANDRFGLMLVSNSSIDELKRGVNADVLFSFPAANNNNLYTRITPQGTIQQVAWEDARGGDGDFNDLGVEISIEQAPNIIGTEQQGSREVIDLRSFTGKKTCDIKITGDAYYSNTVGIYTVDDLDGKINGLSIGDAGYVAAALIRAVASGKKGDDFSVQVDGGTILNSFIVANSSIANILAKTTSTDAVFFGNTVVGNADKADHVRLLGDNKFGFEDLWAGGDRDFNDVVLQIVVRP